MTVAREEIDRLRHTAEAQRYSSGDVHGVSVKPSVLLELLDAAEARARFWVALAQIAAEKDGPVNADAPWFIAQEALRGQLSPSARLASVAGECPSCHNRTLFLGEGRHVTCSATGCADPGAADGMLRNPGYWRMAEDELRERNQRLKLIERICHGEIERDDDGRVTVRVLG